MTRTSDAPDPRQTTIRDFTDRASPYPPARRRFTSPASPALALHPLCPLPRSRSLPQSHSARSPALALSCTRSPRRFPARSSRRRRASSLPPSVDVPPSLAPPRPPFLPPHASSLRARPPVLPSSLRPSPSMTSMHPHSPCDPAPAPHRRRGRQWRLRRGSSRRDLDLRPAPAPPLDMSPPPLDLRDAAVARVPASSVAVALFCCCNISLLH